jgi:hypothetical protein
MSLNQSNVQLHALAYHSSGGQSYNIKIKELHMQVLTGDSYQLITFVVVGMS